MGSVRAAAQCLLAVGEMEQQWRGIICVGAAGPCDVEVCMGADTSYLPSPLPSCWPRKSGCCALLCRAIHVAFAGLAALSLRARGVSRCLL